MQTDWQIEILQESPSMLSEICLAFAYRWSLSTCVCVHVCVYASVSARPADDGCGLSQRRARRRRYRFILTFVWKEAAQGGSPQQAFQHNLPRCVHTQTHIQYFHCKYFKWAMILSRQWRRGPWLIFFIVCWVQWLPPSSPRCFYWSTCKVASTCLTSSLIHFNWPSLACLPPCWSGCFVQLWAQKTERSVHVCQVCLCLLGHDDVFVFMKKSWRVFVSLWAGVCASLLAGLGKSLCVCVCVLAHSHGCKRFLCDCQESQLHPAHWATNYGCKAKFPLSPLKALLFSQFTCFAHWVFIISVNKIGRTSIVLSA